MTDSQLLAIAAYILLFFVGVIAIRAIFGIPKIIRHLRAQTALLVHIAEAQGVDANTAKRLYYEAEGKGYKEPV